MKRFWFMLLMLLAIPSCQPKTVVVYQDDCTKGALKILLEEASGPDRTAQTLYLQYGKKSPLKLNFSAEYQLPVPGFLIPENNLISVIPDGAGEQRGRQLYAIYLDTNQFTRNEYGQFAECFQNHITAINAFLLSHKNPSSPLHYFAEPLDIGAIVYGVPEDYSTKYYSGNGDSLLKIYPGGSARLSVKSNLKPQKGLFSEPYYIEGVLPGTDTFLIFSDDPSEFNFIKNFRNQISGRKLSQDYRIQIMTYIDHSPEGSAFYDSLHQQH